MHKQRGSADGERFELRRRRGFDPNLPETIGRVLHLITIVPSWDSLLCTRRHHIILHLGIDAGCVGVDDLAGRRHQGYGDRAVAHHAKRSSRHRLDRCGYALHLAGGQCAGDGRREELCIRCIDLHIGGTSLTTIRLLSGVEHIDNIFVNIIDLYNVQMVSCKSPIDVSSVWERYPICAPRESG